MQPNASGESYLPIKESDLKPHMARASQLIQKVSFRPTRAPAPRPGVLGNPAAFRETTVQTSQDDTQSLLTIAKAISNDMLLLTDAANHVLTTVREGITLGLHLAGQYRAASGLEQLAALNSQGRLPQAQQSEFQSKNFTSAAVAAFSLASCVVWNLASYETEKVAQVKMPEAEVPEVQLLNHIKAVDCVLYYLCLHIAKSGLVQTDIQMVKSTILYFEAVIKDLKFKEKSFAYADFFTGISYRLADSEFRVKGFEEQSSAAIVVNEFNHVNFGDIVGNKGAKHAARRTAQRLVCYDPVARKNPFSVLGGMPLVRMGFGFPGTGKSLQIAATATLIEQYCSQIGLPFVFHPMPQTVVSTFQGGSAERMAGWMQIGHHTGSVNYLPIDDAEDKFRNRTNEGVSAGVREVISIFLTETEGASAPKNGNTVIELYTNLPDQIDPAVLSRVGSRFSIDGAVAWEDFLDQDYLWLRALGDGKEFVGMSDPRGYEYLFSQTEVATIGNLQAKVGEVVDERLRHALAAADKEHDRKSHGFYAALFSKVKGHYPMFTSRDVRNIQQEINGRITDFDLPKDWFESPATFFGQPFERKVEMLKELRRSCMKGLVFHEIRFQETIRYLATLATIANVERERKIAALMESMHIDRAARERLASRV